MSKLARKNKFFWHVPFQSWFRGPPTNNDFAVGNVGNDIVTTLIDSESVVGSGDAHPEIDAFVVERIIGQYQMVTNDSLTVDRFVHHRVYVSQSDDTSLALRSLIDADDAETSFLWHQVDAFPAVLDGDPWGSWSTPTGVSSQVNPGQTFMGRFGHVDIRVGRRLEGGESLIWHTEVTPGFAAQGVAGMKWWLRILVREA